MFDSTDENKELLKKDIEVFDSNMLKLDKKSYKDTDIYNIVFVTIKKIGYG